MTTRTVEHRWKRNSLLTEFIVLLILSCMIPILSANELERKLAENKLQRLKYNNPGLVVDLGVGLFCWPVPIDVNGDGFTDLVVSCEDIPHNGTYVFLHPGTNDKMPVFKKTKRISHGEINVQVSFVDGKARVLTPGKEYPDFANTGLQKPVPIPIPANVHPNRLRGNMWKYVDFDGDGKLDVLIGIDDWTDYGWDNTFDEQGNWTRGPLRGLLYVVRNTGSNEEPKYDTPYLLKDVDGKNLETFGWPCPNILDWDGDGDLDIICTEFVDSFTYFENIGTRTEPKYASGVKLVAEDGKPLVMELQIPTPTAFDWTGDGFCDLIAGDEDGRIALIENTGKLKDGKPVFKQPVYFQQEADEVKCGALATPYVVDWDGDGDLDIICGNTAGYIVFYENLSGPGVEFPKWNAPKFLNAGGEVIRPMAGPKGSIQGPCEAKWGYTTLTVADWDHDGLLDIMVNTIWGKVIWFKNIGTKTQPELAPAQSVEVQWDGEQPRLSYGWLKPEGKSLLTQWRTTPVMFDWNKDGLMDLIMLDHEGYLAFFERKKVDDKLVLLAPKRVLLDENGQSLQLNSGIAGRSGRRKLCFIDYDGDGMVDFFTNTKNADYYRQIKHENGKWFFQNMGPVDDLRLAGHSTSPAVADFDGNGIPDILIGAEDGYFYYKKNPRTLGAKKPYPVLKSQHETSSLQIEGENIVIAEFKNDSPAFANRDYVWKGIPEKWVSRENAMAENSAISTKRLNYYKTSFITPLMKHGLLDYLEALHISGLNDWGPFAIDEEEIKNVNRFFTELSACSTSCENSTNTSHLNIVVESSLSLDSEQNFDMRKSEIIPKPPDSSIEMIAKTSSTSVPPGDRTAALASLAEEVKKCQKCEILAKSRTQTVFGAGNPHAELVFIGEAPGADEDIQGIPFVGRAGQLLTDMITKGMKIAREDVFLCNILRCRPPGNRNPSAEEAANCRPFLDRTLEIIQPKFICCLGAVAAQNLLHTTDAIGKLRGKTLQYNGIPVICTYHPAYLLRSPNMKKAAWDDLQALMKLMGLPIPAKKEGHE